MKKFTESLYSKNQKYNFISLDEIEENEIPCVTNDYEKIIEKEHLNTTVNRALKNIYPRESYVVKNLFGLNDENMSKTLYEISREFPKKIGIRV